MKAIPVLVLACVALEIAAAEIAVSGTVKGEDNSPVSGALVSVVNAGLSAVTDASGNFTINSTSPSVFTNFVAPVAPKDPVVMGHLLQITVASPGQRVRIDVFHTDGRKVGTAIDQMLPQGVYRCAPVGLGGRRLPTGMYAVRTLIGTRATMRSIMHVADIRPLPLSRTSTSGIGQESRPAKSLAGVDILEVAATGYRLHRQDLTAYSIAGLTITLTKLGQSQPSDYLDSLFRVLQNRLDTLSDADSADAVKSLDFASLRNGFDSYLAANDPHNTKANVGYVVSAVLALNTSPGLWKMVDSLEAYFDAIEGDSDTQGGIAKTVAREGVIGLGKAMAAKTPKVLLAATEPSFPSFLNYSYIQGIAENEVVPVLNNVVRAMERMESNAATSLMVDVEGDSFEIDRGDIYMFDAGIRLARAYLNLICIRNLDIYTPGTTSNSWIDSLRTKEGRYFTIYRLSGDTLYSTYVSDGREPLSFLGRLMRHNLQRNDFLAIRKNNHVKVKADLLSIPALVKAGIASIRAEGGDQSKDIIKLSSITDADSGLVDFRQDLINEGVSAALADKFTSPEKVCDFVSELLNGPYTFDERIDSQRITITVDLTAMLDAPVSDLKSLLPRYEWLPEVEWITWETTSGDVWERGWSEIWLAEDDSLAINPALIDTIEVDPYDSKARVCYLKSAPAYQASTDSGAMFLPLRLTDNAGKAIEFEAIDSLVDAKAFFPYFTDYSLGGLFPGMTREKWLDLVYSDSTKQQ